MASTGKRREIGLEDRTGQQKVVWTYPNLQWTDSPVESTGGIRVY